MGGDRLPAGDHGRHAALRQARRPVRAQGGAAGRARAVPDRLRAMRARPGDDRADRVPRDPGAGRRRPDGQRAGRDRRRRLAARARALHGPVRRRLRRLLGRRAAHRRLLHLEPLVALDLLHQHPARAARAGRPRGVAAERFRARAPCGRLRRGGAARGRVERDRPDDVARRHQLRLGLGADRGARRDRDRRARRVRRCGVARRRADPSPAPVPQRGLPCDERDRVRDRLRAVRRAHLPAAVPAGRPRRLADGVRAAADPGDGGRADRLDRIGPDHLRDRPLQGVPDRRHRARRDRDAAVDPARRRHIGSVRLRRDVRARARPRSGDAGTRARGRTPSTTPISASRPRAPAYFARWAARSAPPRSAPSSPPA